MKKFTLIKNYANKYLIFPGIFLIYLLFLLFQNDGKQALVDVYSWCFFAFYPPLLVLTQTRIRYISFRMNLLWGLLLTVLFISTITSASIGYSIYTLLRYIQAYLIFYIFYSYAKKEHFSIVVNGIIFISIVAISFFVLFFFHPNLIPSNFSVNLIYPFYGHNQLVSLLIFSLPFLLDKFLTNFKSVYSLLLIIFLGGIIFSFSRAAGIIITAYLFIKLISAIIKSDLSIKYFLKLSLILIIMTMALIAYIAIPVFVTKSQFPLFTQSTIVKKQLYKPVSLYENRIKYWVQALEGFNDKPLLGNGPGTFYLISKKYQKQADNYSYYAHNFFIETLAEAGIAGLLTLLMLLGRMLWNIRSSDKNQIHSYNKQLINSIFSGVILHLILANIDYNLNFLLNWSIFWMFVSSLFALSCQKDNDVKVKQYTLYNVSLTILLFFTGIETVSTIATIMPIKSISFLKYINIYNVYTTKAFINQLDEINKLPKIVIDSLIKIHRNDSQILYLLLKVNSDNMKFKKIYKEILVLDPHNLIYHKEYIKFLIDLNAYSELLDEYSYFIKINTTVNIGDQADYLIHSLNMGALTKTSNYINDYLIDSSNYELFIPRLLYVFGLNLLNNDYLKTQKFWELAVESYPRWGVLHAEKASLEFYKFNNLHRAKEIIKKCKQDFEPALHCKQINDELSNLTYPGDLQTVILGIQ